MRRRVAARGSARRVRGPRLCSIGKVTYRWPFRTNEQDVAVYQAIRAHAGLERIYLVAQSDGARVRVGHAGGIVAILIPRLRSQWINHLWFVLRAVPIGLRVRRCGARVFQVSDPTGGGLAGGVIKALTGVPLMVNLQGDLFNLPPGEFTWLRRTLSRYTTATIANMAERVRCVSRGLMDEAVRAGVRSDKLVFVPSRCDTRQFDPARWPEAAQTIRARWAIPRGAPIAVFVGALSVHKGVSHLLRATRSILERHSSFTVLLLGSGDLEARLREEARALGIDANVRFCGRVAYAEVPAYMAAADVLALPSLDEGMPRVVLEAMAMTVPVVASRVGGIPELVTDGETGRLVEPGDAAQLAEALGWVLEHPDAARAWGLRARAIVEARYSFEAGTRAYACIIAELLGPGVGQVPVP